MLAIVFDPTTPGGIGERGYNVDVVDAFAGRTAVADHYDMVCRHTSQNDDFLLRPPRRGLH